MTDKTNTPDKIEQRPASLEPKPNAWVGVAAAAHGADMLQAAKVSSVAFQGSRDSSLSNAGFPRATIDKAGIAIEPCTPPEMNPKDDPRNPASPNYDAKKWAPGPAKPMGQNNDGVITPEELNQHKMFGGAVIMEPETLPYGGMCDPSTPPAPPEKNYDKVPMY